MFGHDELLHTLDEIYGQVTSFTTALNDHELGAASRCEGWNVAHVVFHLLGDPQRALISFATPARGPADADFVSYWRPQQGADVVDPADHAAFVRRAVAAYQRPRTVLRQWQETANAAVEAARERDAAGFVATQGRVLAMHDFLATMIVEATVHYLDITPARPDAPAPAAGAVAVTEATFDGLGAARAPGWDTIDYLLKAAGRVPLTDVEQRALGEHARVMPVLG